MIREALLWTLLEGGDIKCHLCAHRCLIKPGKRGACSVRINKDSCLMTEVYGEVIAVHVDPIEKKPLFHFYPGTKALSVATVGCNFRCSFCQNWNISQAPRMEGVSASPLAMNPAEIVDEAARTGCFSISYTYTEPTIFFEFALDTSRLAKEKNIVNNFVTNGYMTAEALKTINGLLDAANVDLKFFQDITYQKICGARLKPVLETIALMKELGVWVEVTTLVVPGLNDGEGEVRNIARFIASLSPDIPWHISRFHPDYEYTASPPTPLRTLKRAFEIGKEEGLHYVYIGNVWGEAENTFCPGCGLAVIERQGFIVLKNLIRDAKCPRCQTTIAGRF